MRGEIRITRMEESDGGLEMRAEFRAGDGKPVVEVVVCDGMFGHTVDVSRLGDEEPYGQGFVPLLDERRIAIDGGSDG